MLSITGYLLMVAGLLWLLASGSLFSVFPLAIAAQALAVGLMLWARVTFGRRSFHLAANPTEGGLVTTGPYQYIRHPIYTSVCLFIWASVLAHLSWQAVLPGVIVVAGAALRIRCEEGELRARYPEYREYAARTARMIPGVY